MTRAATVPASDHHPSIGGAVSIEIAGEQVHLLPHRAALWGRTLLVADLHLGKTESMRVLGVALPDGVLDESLRRLAEAAAATGAQRILVLGDLLHAPSGLTPGMVEKVGTWRRCLGLDLTIVPGNHDRRLESLASVWGLSITPARLDEGPFTFTHDPAPCAGRYVWGGHLHPAVKIPGGRFPVKLPCFHIGRGVGVLPAFSAFTAGGTLRRRDGDRVFAVAGGEVLEV